MDILVTKRLTIRPPLEVDCDDLALHLADEKLRVRLPGAPSGPGRDDVARWVKERCVAACAGKGFAWTIHRERLIGAITLDRAAGAARLGFFLAPPWTGRGFMAEALDAVLAHAFAKVGMPAVHAAAPAGDTAAERLLAKLGFIIDDAPSPGRDALVDEISARLDRAAFRRAATHLAEAA